MKTLFTIIFFSVFSMSLFGQIDIGFYGGINSYSFSGKAPDDAEYESKYGYLGALNIDFYIFDELALSVQPGYTERGSFLVYRNRFNEKKIDSSFTVTQTFVNIPFNFKIFTRNKHFYFLGGANFDYFLKNTFNKEGEEPKNIDYIFKDYDFSINFGLAYIYFFPNFSLYAEFRYTHGVKNMNKTNFVRGTDDDIYIDNFKTSGMSLLIGFSYRLWSPEKDE